MLERIHKEHENIALLLKVLQTKLEAIRAEERVRYRLIRDIIVYMQEYADKFHHPKEDLIYDYYLANCDVMPEIAERLHSDHKRLSQETLALQDTVDMILMDAVVPLEQFSSRLESYIHSQFEHLNYEEQEVLPAIAQSLSEDDWKQLELNWQYSDLDDPLFGRNVEERFQELAERIKQAP